MTRTTNILGFLAAALLFLAMFAGLFGGAIQVGKWGTRFACGAGGHGILPATATKPITPIMPSTNIK
jgi:hypothetical protein